MQNKQNYQKSDPWLTLSDVTKYTRLSESTIRKNIEQKHLKVSRQTGRLLFKQAWVDMWLEGNNA